MFTIQHQVFNQSRTGIAVPVTQGSTFADAAAEFEDGHSAYGRRTVLATLRDRYPEILRAERLDMAQAAMRCSLECTDAAEKRMGAYEDFMFQCIAQLCQEYCARLMSVAPLVDADDFGITDDAMLALDSILCQSINYRYAAGAAAENGAAAAWKIHVP